MKGERKLRLISGGKDPGPDLSEGEEPSFTDEELAAASALREALDTEPLAAGLRAAYSPSSLDDADLDAILGRALGDESASTSAERAAAERIRAELAGEAPEGREAELLRALKLAADPTELSPERHEAILEVALRAPLRRRGPSFSSRRLAPVTMAALAGVTALAAGVALFVGRPSGSPASPAGATAALVRARSADGLFDAATPFPRSGQESARIDRIASARAADLRQNRFAAWGVK